MMRIHIAIATLGRPELLRQTVDHIALQTRKVDGIMIVAPSEADVGNVRDSMLRPEVAISPKGLCRQRNRALDLLAGRTDVILFLDDDFIMAPGYVAAVEALFTGDSRIAGVTGHLVADGVRHGGYTIEQAQQLIEEQAPKLDPVIELREALYGCNMALRMAHVQDMRFDEALPLYGWQEDVDFTSRLARCGVLVSTGLVTGVHLGVRGGRTSGTRLGYSQVANIVYLRRKGTMPRKLGNRLLWRNIAANAARALFPEPHIDRAGRLSGNLRAFGDLLLGRLDPRRVERM